ncbi:MAG: AMP-binding protein, partial [Algicola sp.]|nr:AMP-binding protein [Algicola sp.]
MTTYNVTIPHLLQQRSKQLGTHCAFRFLHNGTEETQNLTFAQLMDWSNGIAAGLSKVTKPGDCVILSFPAGLEFIAAFYACLTVGVIAVPVAHPSNRKHHWQRVKGITDDCNATLLLTEKTAVPLAIEHWHEFEHPPIMGLHHLDTVTTLPQYKIKPTDIAYLQYTSGSTSAPKGVMVTHQNAVHNVMAIASGLSLDASDVAVSWLPHYHDQGLVGVILTGLWVGIPVILMAPVAFLQNPFHWLEAISRYGGSYSGGPDFAFSFCVEKYTKEKCIGLDLSSWKNAFNGAEPIRSDTLDNFANTFATAGFCAEALTPSYGLAEATLAVSIAPRMKAYSVLTVDKASLAQHRWVPCEDGVEFVSSGRICGEQTVVIVDPDSLQASVSNEIGEIWISGPSVTLGYWQNPEQTAKSMGATLSNHPNKTFLRTGDLGYIHNRELFVAGRITDLLIIRGRNHYPQDIELTVEQTSELFRKSGCAAFGCEIAGFLQLIVVQEIERVAMRSFDPTQARRKVIEQIALNHDIKVFEVVFILPVSLPKTSSGKVQRSRAKQMYLDNELRKTKEKKPRADAPEVPTANNQSKLGVIASEIFGAPVDLNLSLLSLGFDSLGIISFKQAVETQLLVTCPLELLFESHSILALERLLQTYPKITPAVDVPAIGHVDSVNGDSFEMAENQKSLWLAQKMQPNSGAFNLAVPLVLHNAPDKSMLSSAWQSCLTRHPLLAMTIGNEDERVRLIPAKQQNEIIFHQQMPVWNHAQIAAQITHLAQQPPTLHQPKLAALHCWRQDSSTLVLTFIIHHVLVDMWSLLNLLDEFLQIISGKTLLPAPPTFIEYVAHLHVNSQQLEINRNYWQQKFQNSGIESLRLPGNRIRPEKRTGQASSTYLNIGINETNALKNIAKSHGTTLHTLVLAIYSMVLMRFSGQSGVHVGGPTFGREDARFNDTVGFFVNTVVYQLEQIAECTFAQYLEKVNEESRNVIQHRHIAFSQIVKNAGLPPSLGIHPLYQASFTLQNSHRLTAATPMIINGPNSTSFAAYGQQVATFPMPQHSCQVDIALTMVEVQGGLEGRLDFATDVLTRVFAEQLASSVALVMCQLPNQMSCPIESIAIQSAPSPITEAPPSLKAQQSFVSVNQTLLENSQKFAKQTAFISQGEAYEYQQLGLSTARLAGHLKRLNVSQGDTVALACSRSPYWASAMLAIWQVGAVYVPIDDSLPEQRVIDILAQASPKLVLVEGDRLPFVTQKVDFQPLLNQAVEPAPSSNISGDEPAYIIFTSGTSGRPKGVIVNHYSLSNRLDWLTTNIPLLSAERVLHKTPISFDVSLWELLWPLYSGATCVIADDLTRIDPIKLAELMREQQVSTAQFVPSFLAVFVDFMQREWPDDLTRIICGGEVLTPDLAQRLGVESGLELHNLYGPTETGFVTHQQIVNPQDAHAMGDAISHTEVMILDSDDRPTPVGAKGEIVIFGKAVGLGYASPP